MREIVLHDTRTGKLVPLAAARSRARRDLRLRADRLQPHPHRQRAAVRGLQPAQALSRARGAEVTLVINITDVNDKIYDAARAQGRPSAELAAEMTELYRADTDALGLGRPDDEPLASETIGPIIDYIGALVDSGHAYAAGRRRVLPRALGPRLRKPLAPARSRTWSRGRSPRAPSARRTRWTSRCGRRTSRARTRSGSRPGGAGRPGWHIECSAMAEEFLGRRLRHPRRRL